MAKGDSYLNDKQERQRADNSERDEIKYNRWNNITFVMLDTINHESFFKSGSVSAVPDELRIWNELAYMPKVISIGPRHYGRKELLPMEDIKWRCMSHLFNRSLGYTICPQKYVNNCMNDILKMDAAVRSSYVGEIELDRYDLAAIVFNDGCFLLEFLISGSSIDSLIAPYGGSIRSSPVLEIGKTVMEVVMRDLSLLENQIPLFVLDVLFLKIFDNDFHYMIHEIHNRALSLFDFHGEYSNSDNFKFAHFLDLASWNNNKEWEILHKETQLASIIVDMSEQFKNQCLNRCATKLTAFGVTIKPVIDKDPPTQVSTLKFGMKFSDNKGTLEIRQLRITRAMKAKWLNLIAWEHHIWTKPKSSWDTDNENRQWPVATSSAFLINDLICCSNDVKLLKATGVIVVDDDLKMKNRDLMAVFRSLTKGVDRAIIDPRYSTNFDALNKYSATKRIHILLWHYVCISFYATVKFLKKGYNLFATAFALLTVVQTIYAILSYHYPKS